jgi:hypothetical protein
MVCTRYGHASSAQHTDAALERVSKISIFITLGLAVLGCAAQQGVDVYTGEPSREAFCPRLAARVKEAVVGDAATY